MSFDTRPHRPVGTLAHSLAFLRDPARFTAGIGRMLGDDYRIRLPAHNLRVITDPRLVKEILVTRSDDFEKSRVYWRELRRIIGDAMGSLEGPRWRALRSLEQPFFTPRATERILPAATQVILSELDELERRVGQGAEFPILEITAALNTRIVLAVYFGQNAGRERREITERIVDGENTIAWRSRFPWRAITGWLNGRNLRAERHKRFFQTYADQVESSPASRRPGLLLHALANLRRGPEGRRYEYALLRNELIVHLGASSETQGVAEGWCIYLLWQHPDVLERVRSEVREVAGQGPLETKHVADLVFTGQVVRETLRLFPTAYGVVRDCVRPTELSGEPIRPGQVFFISLVGLHRSPRNWPDPDRFDPGRFRPELLSDIDRFRYMPFGGGRHVCIGQHIAIPTMVLTVAEFARRFEWTFVDPATGIVGRATLKPRGPFRALLRRRASLS